jgi:hypothetical protein
MVVNSSKVGLPPQSREWWRWKLRTFVIASSMARSLVGCPDPMPKLHKGTLTSRVTTSVYGWWIREPGNRSYVRLRSTLIPLWGLGSTWMDLHEALVFHLLTSCQQEPDPRARVQAERADEAPLAHPLIALLCSASLPGEASRLD